MSTVGEVVSRTGKLLGDIQELLATDTIKGVLETASALGAQQAVADGLTAIQRGIGKIDQGLTPVVHTLVGIDAAASVFGIVPPVVTGIDLLINNTGTLFTELVPALRDAQQSGKAAGDLIVEVGHRIGTVSQFVDNTLADVDPIAFRQLRERLKAVSATLDDLKRQEVVPPSAG